MSQARTLEHDEAQATAPAPSSVSNPDVLGAILQDHADFPRREQP
jgi:hypothetical protein